MRDGVEFEEMILAAIASDFELGAEPDHSSRRFSPRNGILYVLHIAVEIHSPLVQITRRDFQQPHLFFFSRLQLLCKIFKFLSTACIEMDLYICMDLEMLQE